MVNNHELVSRGFQQLTYTMETGDIVGTAKIVADFLTSEPDQAKALAYRLFTIVDRKGWAPEANAYNSLVIAWPEVQSKAAELQAQMRKGEQMILELEG
jgi:putative DNA methylase